MLLKLYQLTIVVGILFADIYYEWHSEGYAAIAVAILAAYVLTILPIKLYDWSLRIKWFIERCTSRNPQPSDSTMSNHSEALLGDVLRPYLDAQNPRRSQDSVYGPE